MLGCFLACIPFILQSLAQGRGSVCLETVLETPGMVKLIAPSLSEREWLGEA